MAVVSTTEEPDSAVMGGLGRRGGGKEGGRDGGYMRLSDPGCKE